MNKPIFQQPGTVSARVFAAFLLCAASGFLAMLSFASTPSSGTITPAMPLVTYTAGPFFVNNSTPLIEVDVGPQCDKPGQTCDGFALTTKLPARYAPAHPTASVKVTASRTPTRKS